MNRRIALKNIAFSAAGLMLLAGCDGAWTGRTPEIGEGFLSARQNSLLAEIAETIIPATDTPGAKALELHTFIQKMVADCYEPAVQHNLKQGLEQVEKLAASSYQTSFAQLPLPEREKVLLQLESVAGEQSFLPLVKELTIRGYMTAQYVMTSITKYEMVPGRYLGCVTLSPQPQS